AYGGARGVRETGQDETGGRRRRKPNASAEAQRGKHGHARHGDRDGRPDGGFATQKRREETRDRREQRSGRHLLHAAPQRVAVQERGLGRDEHSHAAKSSRPEQRRGERVEGQREQGAQEREVGLEEPRSVLAEEGMAHAQRQKRADRITLRQIIVKDRGIRRRRKAGE